MPAGFDYGAMMGLSDLGPESGYETEDYSTALEMRGQGDTQHQQPWLHQDYTQTNPYDEGGHGAWMQTAMPEFATGMGMLDQAPADAGLAIPLEEDTAEDMEGDDDLYLQPHEEMTDDEETEAMLDEEIGLMEDSEEFQLGAAGMDDEEGY
jgi:hypothetical protein